MIKSGQGFRCSKFSLSSSWLSRMLWLLSRMIWESLRQTVLESLSPGVPAVEGSLSRSLNLEFLESLEPPELLSCRRQGGPVAAVFSLANLHCPLAAPEITNLNLV